jgi:hypothetical protein
MNRKQFLRQSLLAGVGCCCGASLAFARALRSREQGPPSLAADLTERIRDGAKSPDWKKVEKAESWIKSMVDNLDRLLDDQTKRKILNACGRACFIDAFGVADDRPVSVERAQAYLGQLAKIGMDVRRDGDTVTVLYKWGTKQNPYGLSMREGYCMCPIAESGLPGLSTTFCECSGGYVKEGLERGTGMTVVDIEVLESLLRGGKDCRFKVVLKARPSSAEAAFDPAGAETLPFGSWR